jgi:predicted DCC family thiol-disulfide oxidoreductase YuxK
VDADGVLVFDGDCVLCRGVASYAQRHTAGNVELLPGDPATLRRLGVSQADAARAVQWVGRSGERSSGAAAIADWLAVSPARRWRLAGRVLRSRFVPAEAVYRFVARNRRLLL